MTKVGALAAKAERRAAATATNSSQGKGTSTRQIKTLTDLIKSLVKATEDQNRTHQNQVEALTRMHQKLSYA
jgi:hypothetical protein